MECALLNDPRELSQVGSDSPGYEWAWIVGKNGVTKIEVVPVTGHGAYVPWFAVWKGDHCATKRDAAGLYVNYKQEG